MKLNVSHYALAAFIAFSPLAALAENPYETSTLDVTGEVIVKAAPDIAVISAGVMTNAKTAQAAMQDNANKMSNVMAALKKAGVAEKDIQTSGLNLSAQYAYDNNGAAPRVAGYQANNNLSLTLHDIKNAGAVIDALVAQGVNQINGPNFTVDNPEDMLDKARADAVKKAQKRAQIYADAAGVKLKRIISINEQSSGFNPQPPRPMMMMKAMAAESDASTSVAPGEVSYTMNVSIKYEITP